MRHQDSLNFSASKVIVIVRNPFDVIMSRAHMHLTMTHSRKAKIVFNGDGSTKETEDFFERHCKFCVESMKSFYD